MKEIYTERKRFAAFLFFDWHEYGLGLEIKHYPNCGYWVSMSIHLLFLEVLIRLIKKNNERSY